MTEFSTHPTFLSDETLHETYELEIAGKNGEPVRFGELVAGKGDSVTTIVIFGESITYWRYIQPNITSITSTQYATSSASTTKTTSAPYQAKSHKPSSAQYQLMQNRHR